jgi:hypothetical protein
MLFNPKKLDMGQWADAAKSAHMKYGVLTVKHTGGWCLWQSKTTDHDMSMFKNYKNGKGDIVKEFIEAFRSRGLKVGLYYCFPLWGGDIWKNYMTLPHKDYATGKIDALSFVKSQFKELLSNYGKIDLIWIDQNASPNGGLKQGDWMKFKKYVHELQPGCIVIANTAKDFNSSDIIGYEYPYSIMLPPLDNKRPTEVCDKLNAGWFANPRGEAVPVRTADYVANKMLLPLVNRHSNYLLNCSPEHTGTLHPKTVALLKEVGTMWNPENIKEYDKELYGIQKSPVTSVPNKENMVILTLDKNWNKDSRDKAAEILKKYNATGTFFIDLKGAEKEKPELRKLIAGGNSLGNATTTDNPVDILSAMQVRDTISKIQDHLFWVKAPIITMFPEKKYSWNVWTALNYYQLLVSEPKFVIDASAGLEKSAGKISSGDIILLKYSDDALKNLETLLAGLKKRGLKVVNFREAMHKSTSRRLRVYAGAPAGSVHTGRE